MKRRNFKHVVKNRQLTKEESREEEFYRSQLIDSWGWKPGKNPDDIIRKQKEEL